MEINYEIGTINNVNGEGDKHLYVALDLQPALTTKQLEERIEQATTLTQADIRGVLSELRYIIEQSLIAGRRFHLDGIGYLSLSAGMSLPVGDGKITGKNIYLRGINFLPERELLTAVRSNVKFRQSKTTSRSTIYEEEELWQKVEAVSPQTVMSRSASCASILLCHAMLQRNGSRLLWQRAALSRMAPAVMPCILG